MNQKITPWEAYTNNDDKTKGIDYKQLINQFGCSEFSEYFTKRLEILTGSKAHRFFRRNIVFAHRDFDIFLKKAEDKKPIYLYTGRGPSSHSMHLGHTVPFLLCVYLQKAFKMPLVIQITDDEKFLWKNLKIEESIQLGKENVACRANPRAEFATCTTHHQDPQFEFFFNLKIPRSWIRTATYQIGLVQAYSWTMVR
ncbi:tryptophanyl tRNA synthetase [Nosema bombycis CQ1]|uniref:Tryptophanyl-tRNA synthetase n=1 Tax=Nosema bombycis (strain CQ1 / CVCC 102059) TaxID=578461 RepID=R0MAV0_NOSB1|nr:tryptophanyl tRNA synthetase [Nosema bombycis CQ1]|eukprot:EOB11170.1 tryptophanyl tRNA synthetase [Nosema bombycis CQ1]